VKRWHERGEVMVRRLGLLLGLLISIVVLLPFATSTAHNLRSNFSAHHHRFHHHSRAWWRRHRALRRRRQAAIARRRALQATLRNNGAADSPIKSADNHVALPSALALPESVYRDGAFVIPLPNSWSAGVTTKGESTFRIEPPNGAPEAHATLAVVALAPSETAVKPLPSEQRKMLGGVAFTDLRRTVIDKMVTAGGWVINDRQREIGGHRVFEVIAQTPANTDTKSDQVWNFYFTEINGRVYSLTTRSAAGATDKVAVDAEQFITTFRPMEPKR
jgi:hypothetical protein